MATSLQWHPLPPSRTKLLYRTPRQFIPIRHMAPVQAFRRSDFDMFARRVTSGEAWRDAWRRANDGFEQFVFETKKTAERIDRRYSVSQRLNAAAQSTLYRAREIDREFEITDRWRTFTLDFSRNWPRVCSFYLCIIELLSCAIHKMRIPYHEASIFHKL